MLVWGVKKPLVTILYTPNPHTLVIAWTNPLATGLWCLFTPGAWKRKERKEKRKKTAERFCKGPLQWFCVFWHLQLVPGCRLTLRNRCCLSACHGLLFLFLLSGDCALVNSVCICAPVSFWAMVFCCNEGMTARLGPLIVNYSHICCASAHLFMRLRGSWCA